MIARYPACMGRVTCDVCGGDLSPGESVTADLSVADLTCPTPMTLHPACFERAAALWTDSADSLCIVDPDYPETQTWTPVTARRGSS